MRKLFNFNGIIRIDEKELTELNVEGIKVWLVERRKIHCSLVVVLKKKD